MAYVTRIEYVVTEDTGGSSTKITYDPNSPQDNVIDEETMSAIIKLVDGMDVQDLIEELI